MMIKTCPGLLPTGHCVGDKRRICDVTSEMINSWFDESLEIINVDDVCGKQSHFGNSFFKISTDLLEALKDGKVLYSLDEYGTFIILNDEKEKDND